MEVISNIDKLLGDDLKKSLGKRSKVSIAASCFSIYAYKALKEELEQVEEFRFIFTSPAFITDRLKKEKREFYIPKRNRERSLYGTEFEIKLKNELTQKAIARECSKWIRRKATFKSNRTSGSLHGMVNIEGADETLTYMPINGFTTVDLGYEKGNDLSNMVTKMTDYSLSKSYIDLFEQVWRDKGKLEDVTADVIEHITAVYQENAPEFIYYVILYNIFNELRNKTALVLCPKKLGDNWLTYKQNVSNNILFNDRLRYDVLYHTDIMRERGYSNGIPLDRLNWGNYDLLVIDESHNFRNNDAKKDKENRYQRLMRKVIKSGVKTKVPMLSGTPVNNKFNDLRNQLALAYEGNPEEINKKLNTERGINSIFQRAQAAFSKWSVLPAEQRTTQTLLDMLEFDFFELLDSLTIARSRRHIERYYKIDELGDFPQRLKTPSHTVCMPSLTVIRKTAFIPV